jgi:hypothetical protein
MAYVAEFTADIQHVAGQENVAADVAVCHDLQTLSQLFTFFLCCSGG